MDEKQLNEIRYVMMLAANQLVRDGHDELGHDLDDMRARLLLVPTIGPCGVPLCDADACHGGDAENGPPGPAGLYRSIETGA